MDRWINFRGFGVQVIQSIVDAQWTVKLVGEAVVPLPASAVWGQMRGFTHFATIDPFHARIMVEGGGWRQAAAFTSCIGLGHFG